MSKKSKDLEANPSEETNAVDPDSIELVAAPSLKRLAAFSLDYLVISLSLSALFPLFVPDRWDLLSMEDNIRAMAPVYLVGIVAFLFKDHVGGRSIGKAFFNLYVASMNETFPVASSGQMLKRNLWLLILPVEVFKLIFDPYCRRFGDRSAKTVVMEIRRPPAVRRLTTKAVGFMLVVSVLWSAYVQLTPLKVEKSAGYQVAKEALLNDAKTQSALGGYIAVSNRLEVSYEQGKEVYIFHVNEEKQARKVQVVLERIEDRIHILGVFLLQEKKGEEKSD